MPKQVTTIEEFDAFTRSLRGVITDHLEAGGKFTAEYDNTATNERMLAVSLVPLAEKEKKAEKLEPEVPLTP